MNREQPSALAISLFPQQRLHHFVCPCADCSEIASSVSSAYCDSTLCTCCARGREAWLRSAGVFLQELMWCVCSPGLCLGPATDVVFPFQPLHLLPPCCPGRFCLGSAIQAMPATVTASIKATAVFSPFANAPCEREHALATGGGGNQYAGKLLQKVVPA